MENIISFENVRPLSATAKQILNKRYLWENEKTWDDLVHRVMNYIVPVDSADFAPTQEMIMHRYFVPNSPCLVNAGKKDGGLLACVPEYVRIPTNEGLIKISEVISEDRYTHVYDGTSLTEIDGKIYNGIKPVFRIYTERGHKLDLTEDHLVLVYNNKGSNSKSNWKHISDVQIGDILEFDNRGSSFPNSDFDSDLGILLGYLYSDGCFTEDPRNGSRIIEFIVNSHEERDTILRCNYKFTGENNLNVIDKEKYIRLRGYKKERYTFLEKYQPFFGSICRVPDEIFKSNHKTISNFISALFSADGSISFGKKSAILSLSMNNEEFIYDVGRLLELYGIRYSISKWEDKRTDYNRLPSFSINISDKYSIDLFKNNIGFFNPAKNEKLIKYLNNTPLIGNQNHTNNLKVMVKSKEYIGDFPVYDIQTKSHKFLSDNFVVHNCFVVDFQDTTEDILKTIGDFTYIARKGGGAGTTLTNLRPKGAKVGGSTHGYAGGPVAFADVVSHMMKTISQGGLRSMALMFVMSCYHPDIVEFIKAKESEDDKKIENANMSVMVDSTFMNLVREDKTYWTEFNGVKYKEYRARDVFNMIVDGAWRNGEPGLLFQDRINDSPYNYTGQVIQATNPCAEQGLPPNGSCNLGSIDISKFVGKEGTTDCDKLEYATRLGVRFLDRVIDKNSYPTDGIESWAKANRPIGVGLMGFADYLLMKKMAYGSEESLRELDNILGSIYTWCKDESEKLGRAYGIPKECKKLPELRRNITITTVAPTGTVSLISGCSSGIEPIFSEIVIRNDKTGTYIFEDKLADKPYFRCAVSSNGATEVTWEEHVKVLATAQKNIDSGVSKTINFPNHTHRDTVYKAMFMAWEMGCKGIAVYRNGSRKQEVLTVKNVKKDLCPVCESEMQMISGKLRCMNPSCNPYKEGDPIE